jgi:hypothetical protein
MSERYCPILGSNIDVVGRITGKLNTELNALFNIVIISIILIDFFLWNLIIRINELKNS